ncbi:MAG: hypothetical protein GY719_01130 [bacterium]|nr:hypothetical protein [bacterium]
MLSSPSHVVIGCSDLEKTERFLRHFGFEGEAGPELSAETAAALYGLDGPARQRVLRTPGADFGWARLVATPHGAREAGPYDARPIAIDFYTRDIHRSIEISRSADAEICQLVEFSLGPLEIQEVEVVGPDHLMVVFIGVNKLRPSVLDRDPDRLHSEIHSVVFSVQSAEASLPFWTETAGLQTLIDAPIKGPIISELMGLPRPDVPVRFALMCDDDSNPARFELLEFYEDPGAAQPTWPLAAGLHAPAFDVDDLDAVMAGLTGAELGTVVEVEQARAVSAVAPGGVRFEVWQTKRC